MSNHPSQPTLAIVISGCPASGKTTIGKFIASQLNLPLLDKDDYLEALFDEKGCSDPQSRQLLSREADLLFIDQASQLASPVLISHWRAGDQQTSSGTPTAWLTQHFQHIIEVYCRCDILVSARRFELRSRHPGHCDALKQRCEIERWFANYDRQLPLRIDQLLTIDTLDYTGSQPLLVELAKKIRHCSRE